MPTLARQIISFEHLKKKILTNEQNTFEVYSKFISINYAWANEIRPGQTKLCLGTQV